MPSAAEVGAHRYVLLHTRKRDGSTVGTPVWIADLGDGTVGFTTEASAGKVKRVRNFPEVTLRPCDMRGRFELDAPVWSARAEVRHGDAAEPVMAAVRRKYGWQYRMIVVTGTVRQWFTKKRSADCAIVLHLDA